jgi:23S rRNA (cytosine1962-C5)-methyltransferase
MTEADLSYVVSAFMHSVPSIFQGYELLASGDGQRLESWCGITVLRPESAATWRWKDPAGLPDWEGQYSGDRATGGRWNWRKPLPDPSVVRYGSLCFRIRQGSSKHLGLFPEQGANWEWVRGLLGSQGGSGQPRILNLFGYTGGATLAAAQAGAAVTHVDAVRSMVAWCSENARLSQLGGAPIRYIVEDALNFLRRELRRGNRYEGVIMDPPAFGRGSNGERWKLPEHLPELIGAALDILSEAPRFLLLNTYSDSLGDAEAMVSKQLTRGGGRCERVGLGLRGTLDSRWLPCGTAHRWTP